ncbi:MAG: hypothetical protein IR153_08190 [Flavobacterium sp.]|nr:hypothetical protein [Flavobacterium sp.]
MKKILFIILCTTIFSCNSSKDIIKGNTNRDADSTKTNTYVVEYDFQTGVYKSNNMPLRVNNPVVYKITNVNRLAYEVSVKSKDSILADSNWSQQNLLDQIKAQDQLASLVHTRLNVDASLGHPIPKTIFSDDFHKDVKPEQIKAFNEDLKKVNDSQKIIEDMAMLYVKRSQIEFKITAKNNDLYFQREILDTVRDIGEKAQLETQMLRLNNEIVELTEQRKAVIDDIDKKTSALVKYQSTNVRLDAYRENLAKLRTSFTKLRSYYNNLLEIQVHNNKLHEAGRNPILTHQKFEQLYKIKLDSLPDRLSLYENSYRVFSELYSEFNLDYTTIINSMDLSDI